ncbi:MAG: WYL domain-containing protein [Clostridiaceae bacterium]|jgi:hypothetical protein|nr:WYL domain-containing protein [Clostridiaceae bacterium]
MTRISNKYNDSCIKIFEILKLLFSDSATYERVLEIIDSGKDEKLTAAVVLNKYLNTLKVFGINVEKRGNKYELVKSPYKIDFEKPDLESLKLLMSTAQYISSSKSRDIVEQFLKMLFLRLNDADKVYLNNVKCGCSTDLSFYYKQFKDQIDICEKLCVEKQKIEISYSDTKGCVNTLIGIPIELKYQNRKICFSMQSAGIIHDIPINKINSVNQLPNIIASYNSVITVVFRLKKRLAKSYKLKDGEYIQNIEKDGSIIVVNKGEDIDKLIARFIRYQNNCEVISPKFFKEKLLETLSKMIARYKN